MPKGKEKAARTEVARAAAWLGMMGLIASDLELRACAPLRPVASLACETVDARPADGHARWYAVQCLSHREAQAAHHLNNQSFCAFLPRRKKTRRHARRLDTVLAPFFPGYLFVRLDLTQDKWRSVNGTYGVARLIAQGDAPCPVPHGVVENLQAACDAHGVMQREFALSPGQAVRILTGPFADLVGRLDRLADADRVRVLLDIMGGRVPVVLSRDGVEPEDVAA
ncbi:MAG: transcriptional activator RfaH [Proteobacteria bacterium]|nr:transcriptional activator RfaH [Pseudomonadota bacterium]